MKFPFLIIFFCACFALEGVKAEEPSLDSLLPWDEILDSSTLIGTGTVSIQSMKSVTQNAFDVSGTIAINSTVISNCTLPVSIKFSRKAHWATFASDPVWGIIYGGGMDGLKVIVFASGTPQNIRLLLVRAADPWSQQRLADLKLIMENKDLPLDNVFKFVGDEHPLAAVYFLKKIVASGATTARKIQLIKRVLNSNNEQLSQVGSRKALALMQSRIDDQSRHVLLTAVLEDFINDDKGLENKLSTFNMLGVNEVKKNPDWCRETATALSAIQKRQTSTELNHAIETIIQALK